MDTQPVYMCCKQKAPKTEKMLNFYTAASKEGAALQMHSMSGPVVTFSYIVKHICFDREPFNECDVWGAVQLGLSLPSMPGKFNVALHYARNYGMVENTHQFNYSFAFWLHSHIFTQ